MGYSANVLKKIARNAKRVGLTVNTESSTQVIIEDGANDLLITYEDATIGDPMGGVSDASAPFLGIGTGNPGKIVICKNNAGNDVIADIFATVASLKVLAICAGFANNILVMDGNEGVGTAAILAEIDGDTDLKCMGQ